MVNMVNGISTSVLDKAIVDLKVGGRVKVITHIGCVLCAYENEKLGIFRCPFNDNKVTGIENSCCTLLGPERGVPDVVVKPAEGTGIFGSIIFAHMHWSECPLVWIYKSSVSEEEFRKQCPWVDADYREEIAEGVETLRSQIIGGGVSTLPPA